MVEPKKLLKVTLAALLLALSVVVSFIAQLYAPTILWILSGLAIVYVTISPFIIYKKKIRVIGIWLCSLIICASYLFYSLVGGSLRDFVTYGLTLWGVTWLILFFLSETMASLTARRLH